MQGHLTVTFVNAKRAKETYRYRNTEEKLYKTDAAVWYNKMCREKQLTPRHMSIEINVKNSQYQETTKDATLYRLN